MGMMGSGKSTIGRLLSERTGWPYHDNDALLQRDRGLTARELLAVAGEEEMRVAEGHALRLGLAQPEPCIVGAPAGTIIEPDSRAALAGNSLVVWLRASPQTLAGRAAGAAHRPWLDGDAEGWMRRTLEERGPLYESVADYTIDTDGRSPHETVADILAWLNSLDACGAWFRDA